MGWLTDYIEKLSLVDYATEKLNPAQKSSPFLWKPFSRKSREVYFAEQRARAKEAEERFAREKARREKMYAEQEKLHAMRKKWADEMQEILRKDDNTAESHEESDQQLFAKWEEEESFRRELENL